MEKSSHIRFAERGDEKIINDFLSSRIFLHRHLDWRSPTEWLGSHPYLILFDHTQNIQAVINCAPEPSDHFWIRLYACKKSSNPVNIWQQLFPHTEKNANRRSKNPMFITLAYQDWWKDLLEIEGWEKIQEVVQLEWNPRSRVSAPEKSVKDIRKLRIDDIAKIKLVDDAGFKPLWRQSFAALKNAYYHADYATVFHVNNQILGFQISTLERKRAHLARIAVLPEYQKKGFGSALVNDLISYYSRKGIFNISVNTQSDNKKSLAFYKQLNFEETGESFPIYSLK